MSTGPVHGSGWRERPGRAEPVPDDEEWAHFDWEDPDSACPPELADVPFGKLFAEADARYATRLAETPPESLSAGFLPRDAPVPGEPRPGFAAGGPLDALEPGAALAGFADAATWNTEPDEPDGLRCADPAGPGIAPDIRQAGQHGSCGATQAGPWGGQPPDRLPKLADLDDDSLIGVLRAWRRLESWCAASGLAAVAELARRRPADRTPAAKPGQFPPVMSEFIVDEVGAALVMSGQAADRHLELALDLAARLPRTAESLRLGLIDMVRARIIAAATNALDDSDAGAVESAVLRGAGDLTPGQLRAALARAVLATDPDGAEKRRERAAKDARVLRWREDAGTAALCGRDLPSADVLAADQRITARARELKAAGAEGTMDELRARAYLGFLLDRPFPDAGRDGHGTRNGHGPRDGHGTRDGNAADSSAQDGTTPPAIAARLNLTIPLMTLLGLSARPGEAAGFGAVDAGSAMDLAAAAAAHPATRWSMTLTDEAGEAIGYGRARRPPRRTAGDGRDAPGHPGMTALEILGAPLTVTVDPLATETCDHRYGTAGYVPSAGLRSLIEVRNTTCTFPRCRRPAALCDQDHTVAYDKGGRTCECGIAPVCRHHHKLKQSQGWRLEQPKPGILLWTTPTGRRYVTERSRHPI